MGSLAQQLLSVKNVTQSSHVRCNIVHYDGKAALVGDATHGGVQQGLNATLQDSVLVADCLVDAYSANAKEESLHSALLLYSQRAAPEHQALDELSFGPKTAWNKVRWAIKSMRDMLFRDSSMETSPILLTTSLQPSAIRKTRDGCTTGKIRGSSLLE